MVYKLTMYGLSEQHFSFLRDYCTKHSIINKPSNSESHEYSSEPKHEPTPPTPVRRRRRAPNYDSVAESDMCKFLLSFMSPGIEYQVHALEKHVASKNLDQLVPSSVSPTLSRMNKIGLVQHMGKRRSGLYMVPAPRVSKDLKTQQEAKGSGKKPWSKNDIEKLKWYSAQKTPVKDIAETMDRTQGSIRQKALELGLSIGHRRK